MTSRTNHRYQNPHRAPKETCRSRPLECRRQQAIARYLDGDPIEAICREMKCSKSWLYKWRDRYQADNPSWAQEISRRPVTSPAKLSATLEEEIMRLRQTLSSIGSGPASAAAIRQALENMAIEPVPSLRTIYRVLQRHEKEVLDSPSMP
jgi:transposase-like protein